MTQKTGSGVIADAIAAATTTGYIIKIGPGTYTENPNTSVAGVTFVATGTATETIIKGTWIIDVASTVIDGLTIQGAVSITGVLANKATIQNCVLSKASSTSGATLLTYGNTATDGYGTVTNCTFDTTLGAVADTAIDVNQDGLTISGCTFSVDAGNTAVNTAASSTLLPTKVTGCTFTGASGDGVLATAGVSSIKTNTFSGLQTAIDVDGVTPTVTIDGNTITNCGAVPTTTVLLGWPAIEIDVTGAGTGSCRAIPAGGS